MTRRAIQQVDPICVEDGKMAVLVTGREIYPDREDLWRDSFYRCACGAFVGVHRGTDIPVGYPAGPHTRRARRQAREAMDSLIQRKINRDKVTKREAETLGFAWLAGALGIRPDACHFAMMDAKTCQRVVALVMNPRTTP